MFGKRFGLAVAVLTALVAASPSWAGPKEQSTVEQARQTITNFARDPNMVWFRDNIGRARGVLIIPTSVKAGFIVGGSGGNGVLLGRSPRTGRWSYPAFYSLGSLTFGLQIGGEVSEIVLMVMTNRGMDALLSTSFKLGGDVSIAVGPVGAGAKAQVADIIAFARTKGLYGGINIEGAIVSTDDDANAAYYGRRVSPSDIFVRRIVRNPGADGLRATVARIAARSRRR
jgi:lipid-binding SYLF domain-containing protein